MVAKDLPPFYDSRIEEKRDELEKAKTHHIHISEDFNSTRKIEYKEEEVVKGKSQSQRGKCKVRPPEQGL